MRLAPTAQGEKENTREWSDELRARALVCSWSYIHGGQDVRLRFECSGRQYRHLRDGHELRFVDIGRQSRGRQTGYADGNKPEQKASLCRRTLTAGPRADFCDRSCDRCSLAKSIGAITRDRK